MSNEMREREQALLFGAVESGPLAIAKLHAAAIAQQELDRLMSNSAYERRGVELVSIRGGEDGVYEFARWESAQHAFSSCTQSEVREFTFQDSIHPYRLEIHRDACLTLPEEVKVKRWSIFACLSIGLIAFGLLTLVLIPVADSLRKAEYALSGSTQIQLDDISFRTVRSLVSKTLRSFELERNVAIAELATQVAHDIRSPLSALNLVAGTLHEVSEEKRLVIQAAATRINSIANDLLEQSKRSGETKRTSFRFSELTDLASAVIEEKRIQLGADSGIIFDFLEEGNPGALVAGSVEDFGRSLSNLVDNSIEAIGTRGSIKVSLNASDAEVRLSVFDSGKGMTEELIRKLGTRGVSSGKYLMKSGSGLGVYQTRRTVEAAGGRISIRSTVGVGTKVAISLPLRS